MDYWQGCIFLHLRWLSIRKNMLEIKASRIDSFSLKILFVSLMYIEPSCEK
ncbi:hypothetical protein EDC32_1011153 [Laceyella sacchari]|nr:hypothetical protein EDC32_1011153 [Laceyella sacchari]